MDDKSETQSEAATQPTTSLWVFPIPRNRRYDPDKPFGFGLSLNLLFAFASTFTVANLYYSQPILVALSETFEVDYNQISSVPTLSQAGYAVGILLISPLGDLVRRRSLVLLLILVTATLSIGLAVTDNLATFQALSFIIAVCTVTPQIMIPLTADLAPESKRAASIAITLSGLMLGVLVARVLSGVITNYASYKYVYWMSVGLQYFIFGLLYAALPDFPPKTKGISYLQMLWSMATYIVKYPTLVQCCILGFLSSVCFTNWWTTLSFLLADPPYNYNPFQIGLFGLVGVAGICTAPFTGKLVDRLVPWVGQLVAITLQIIFQAIAVGAANRNVGAVVVVCWGLDVGIQMGQVSNSTRVYSLDPAARARMNSVFIISLFLGQTTGSTAGTHLYTGHGWVASSSLSLGLLGLAFVVLFARGPHTDRWVGWDGGSRLTKERLNVKPDCDIKGGGSKAGASTDEEQETLEKADPPVTSVR